MVGIGLVTNCDHEEIVKLGTNGCAIVIVWFPPKRYVKSSPALVPKDSTQFISAVNLSLRSAAVKYR